MSHSLLVLDDFPSCSMETSHPVNSICPDMVLETFEKETTKEAFPDTFFVDFFDSMDLDLDAQNHYEKCIKLEELYSIFESVLFLFSETCGLSKYLSSLLQESISTTLVGLQKSHSNIN